MEKSFWQVRWDEDRIGFHKQSVNPNLVRHLDALVGDENRTVLVPLCGKSLDLVYLAERGHRPVGVELIEKAARAFFEERGVAPDESTDTGDLVLRGEGVTIVCGDIFDIGAETLASIGSIDAIWDRAALVALPVETRRRYAPRLVEMLAESGPRRTLLNAFDYDESVMSGPPFSVTEEEISELYAGSTIELLERVDVAADAPFPGHRYWNTSTYLITSTS